MLVGGRYFQIAIVTLLLCVSCSSIPQDDGPWTYIVGADPQLYMKQDDDRYWRAAVDAINEANPEFVIVCGDLINAANNPDKWKEPERMVLHNKMADDYLRGASALHVPIYNVAGNHDVSLRPTPETLSWYTNRFGPAWYSFEHRGSLFVVLESNLLREPVNAPLAAQTQWEWLEKTIRSSTRKPYLHKTVYLHHPLCVRSVDEADDYHNLPSIPRMKLIKLLQLHKFNAVFCGHLHRNAYVKHRDLEIITTSSCCVPLGKDPRGLRLVTVYPDRLEHRYVSIEELMKSAPEAGQ